MAGLLKIKKDQLANVYLFYGPETFKKRNYKEQLKKAVTGGNDMNFSWFEGKNIDLSAVYDSVVTLPFFAEYRLVIVENSGCFTMRRKPAAGAEAEMPVEEDEDGQKDFWILKILEDLPETTILAFIEENAAKTLKIFKTIASKGVVCECVEDSEKDVEMWLLKGFSSAGKKVRQSTLRLLIDRVGADYDRLRTEYEKIIGYVGSREEITDRDVLDLTVEDIESKVFDMLGAMCDKNTALAMKKYNDLLINREPPQMILAMIRSKIREIIMINDLLDSGFTKKEAAGRLKKRDFVIDLGQRYGRRFGKDTLETALDEISAMDAETKNGNLNAQLAVELLIVKYSK